MRILVAEDDDMIGESLVAFLESEDYAVDWVRDGQSALLAMKTTPFSLVILDLGLPGKDGLQVLKEVRARRDPTPVLVTTARDTVDDRVKGLGGGKKAASKGGSQSWEQFLKKHPDREIK